MLVYSTLVWLFLFTLEPLVWIIHENAFWTILWYYTDLAIPHFSWYSSLWSSYWWVVYAAIIYSLKTKYKFLDSLKAIFILPFIAIFIEIIFNLWSLIIMKDYLFYYDSWDLFHLSTFLVYPYYFLLSL